MVKENQVLRKQNQYSFFSVRVSKAAMWNICPVALNYCHFSVRKEEKYRQIT